MLALIRIGGCPTIVNFSLINFDFISENGEIIFFFNQRETILHYFDISLIYKVLRFGLSLFGFQVQT